MKCASDHPELLRSPDFGDTSVDRLPPEPPSVPFLPSDLWVGGADDVWFPDENASRGVFHSSDGGLTWETFAFGGSTIFDSVWGSGPRDVYVGGFRNTTNGTVYLMMHGHD
jgi:hypothetical protein